MNIDKKLSLWEIAVNIDVELRERERCGNKSSALDAIYDVLKNSIKKPESPKSKFMEEWEKTLKCIYSEKTMSQELICILAKLIDKHKEDKEGS